MRTSAPPGLQLVLAALLAGVSAGCSNPTLFLRCEGDEQCAGALQCLEAAPPLDSGEKQPVCTTPCASDGDCPIQQECGGTGDQRRARCVDGVCSVRFCD